MTTRAASHLLREEGVAIQVGIGRVLRRQVWLHDRGCPAIYEPLAEVLGPEAVGCKCYPLARWEPPYPEREA